ncbi:MAG: molybdenum ABC transporter ATP-binding protein [Aestuariibacter sp.]
MPQAHDAPIPLQIDADLSCSGITAIYGPSGAGKTTLLRCIAGLHNMTGAEIRFAEQVWQSEESFVPPHQRQIGYVFQEPGLFPHLNVAGNLMFAQKRSFQHCSSAYQQQVIDILEIEPLLSTSVMLLSGGERQRVAIARALMSCPGLLLLDEPLSALDEQRKKRILRYLEELQQTLSLPMLYVSHQRDEVIQLADQVLMLENGKLKTLGPPSEVFADVSEPKQLESVLSGVVARKHQQWQLLEMDCNGFSVWLQDHGHAPQARLKVRILPKDVSISLTKNDASSMLNIVPGIVEHIDEVADSPSLIVTLNVADNRLFANITRYSSQRLNLQPGMAVWAQIKSLAVLSQ